MVYETFEGRPTLSGAECFTTMKEAKKYKASLRMYHKNMNDAQFNTLYQINNLSLTDKYDYRLCRTCDRKNCSICDRGILSKWSPHPDFKMED